MSTTIWTGGTSGDWGNAANWSGIVPIDGDIAIFPDTASQSVTAGLDQGAIDLEALIIHPGYTGKIGTSSGGLLIAANLVWFEGSNDFYIEGDAGGAATKIDRIFVKAKDPNVIVSIDSAADPGGVVLCDIVRGNVTLGASLAGMTRLNLGHVDNIAGDVTVTVAAGGQTQPLVIMNGGTLKTGVVVTEGYANAGRWIHDDGTAVTNAQIGGNCQFVYNSSSTMALCILGGTSMLDLKQNALVKIVTELQLQGQSRLMRFDDGQLHTITKTYDLRSSN